MTTVAEGLEFHKPGNGIAFTIPLSGVSSPVTSMLSDDIQRLKERLDEQMEVEMEKSREEATHDLIVASVNQGFSDDLMEAAREAGATGGTLIHARKIGMDEVVKFFGISLQAEKEIVTILTVKKDKKAIMQAINKACGMRTEARGVFFSLPVDSVTGISHDED